jgi:hypothetical protein
MTGINDKTVIALAQERWQEVLRKRNQPAK